MSAPYEKSILIAIVILGTAFMNGCFEKGQEEHVAKTEINLSNNGLEVKIFPTNETKVNGVITVELEKIPSKATKILVSMVPQGFSGDLYNNSNVIIQWINNPYEGQQILLDTTKVENGVYGIGVSATYEGAPESSPWIALVQTQVNVEN